MDISMDKFKKEGSDTLLIAMAKSIKKYNKYLDNKIKEEYSDMQLSPNEIQIIIYLMRNKNYNTAKEICIYTNVSKSLVSRSINMLEKKKIIISEQDKQDKRNIRLFLTKESESLQRFVEKQTKEFFQKALEGIEEREYALTIQVFEKIYKNVNNIDVL